MVSTLLLGVSLATLGPVSDDQEDYIALMSFAVSTLAALVIIVPGATGKDAAGWIWFAAFALALITLLVISIRETQIFVY
jgi:hypothetical protein